MSQNLDGLEVTHIIGGQCLVTRDPDRIFSTVLGSCVSACIYDPLAGIGGMNHFVLPRGGDKAPVTQKYRYGDIAMASLVDSLCRNGARAERLVAKLYGGRLRDDSGGDPGALNAEYAKHFLRMHRIKLIEASLGGQVARWVTFHPTTGKTTFRETNDIIRLPTPATRRATATRRAS
ncbi:chemotaxis protein CheD [Affinirhizobium pseudoryzae]|uniref:chemotaxis protein CheD n=1 Tax=Allorhizobium pseudoryzae TaxID=379684 RepID=UPI0013EC1866|nr:chemotaxis protein CheD [Allorhizobium pseudoryzae]